MLAVEDKVNVLLIEPHFSGALERLWRKHLKEEGRLIDIKTYL